MRVVAPFWRRWVMFFAFVLGGAIGAAPACLHAQEANRLQLAGRYAADGQTEKALALYEELYKEDPQIFVYQGYLSCLQTLSQFDKAEKLIRRQMKASALSVLVKVDLAQN
ncbi:MAG: hypothetical protein K2O37_03040, partial [Bacteroidales bacterium]|nr:hypothetical protein [Bacteroidales bacterium]